MDAGLYDLWSPTERELLQSISNDQETVFNHKNRSPQEICWGPDVAKKLQEINQSQVAQHEPSSPTPTPTPQPEEDEGEPVVVMRMPESKAARLICLFMCRHLSSAEIEHWTDTSWMIYCKHCNKHFNFVRPCPLVWSANKDRVRVQRWNKKRRASSA